MSGRSRSRPQLSKTTPSLLRLQEGRNNKKKQEREDEEEDEEQRGDDEAKEEIEKENDEKKKTRQKTEARAQRQRKKAVESYVYGEYCSDTKSNVENEDEYNEVLEKRLRRAGVKVDTRAGEGGGGGAGRGRGTGTKIKKTEDERKTRLCRVLKATQADIANDKDDKLDHECMLQGKHKDDIPSDRLIRLKVAPIKTNWRCYDVVEIERRIKRSSTFAAHFSPYQRQRISDHAELVLQQETETKKTNKSGSGGKVLQPCEAYSGRRVSCQKEAPRCSYNTRTLISDLLRRSTSLYADGECHPVVSYVRQLGASCATISSFSFSGLMEESEKEERERTRHLRVVLQDMLGRAIQKNLKESPNSADEADAVSPLLALENDTGSGSSSSSSSSISTSPQTKKDERKITLKKKKEKENEKTSDEVAIQRYEIDTSLKELKKNLAARLETLSAPELCRILNANLGWYLDDTLSVHEKYWLPKVAVVGSLLSPLYEAASTSAESFLQLLGFDLIPLSLMRKLVWYAIQILHTTTTTTTTRKEKKTKKKEDTDQDEQVKTVELRVLETVEEKEQEDADKNMRNRILVPPPSSPKELRNAMGKGGDAFLRTIHFVANSTLAFYSTFLASYGAYFLLTPGGWAVLDKVRRNPSLASISGVVLALLLDTAVADPLALLGKLGLQPSALSAVTRTATEAIPFGANIVGFLAGDLINDAPKLAAALDAVRERVKDTKT